MVSKQDASIANSALREFADERVARGIDARYINLEVRVKLNSKIKRSCVATTKQCSMV